MTFGRSRPTGEIASGCIDIPEAKGVRVGVHENPGRGLPGQGVVQTGDDRTCAVDVAPPRQVDRLAELSRFGPRQGMGDRVGWRRRFVRRGLDHLVHQFSERVGPLGVDRLGARTKARQRRDARDEEKFAKTWRQRSIHGTHFESYLIAGGTLRNILSVQT